MLPRAYQSQSLPRWAYLSLAVACLCMGLWCSYITLQYFEHGSKALETDAALQSLALSASLMFVGAEMGAFGLAAVLTERQLKARRWMLMGFAAAVLSLEVWTIVAVQLALTSGATLAQTTVETQEKDLRDRIGKIESDAATKRATAEQQRSAAKNAYELHLASKSADKAAVEQDKTKPLYDELAKLQAQKRPTLTGLMGEKTALSYSVYRGVLVSLGGLVFFGTAGALVRMARGGVSIEVRTLEILERLESSIGAPVEPAPALALAGTGASAPALDAPTDADALLVRRRGELGRLLVKGASGASKQTHPTPPGASELTHTAPAGASEQTQPVTRTKAPRQHKSTAVAAGAKCDTGTGEHDGHRYRRVKAAVQARTLDPGLRAIQKAEGGGAPTVRGYLSAMCAEGIIRQLEDGTYELIGGAA